MDPGARGLLCVDARRLSHFPSQLADAPVGPLGCPCAECPSPSAAAGRLSKLQVGGHQEAKPFTPKPQKGSEASQASDGSDVAGATGCGRGQT